VNADWLGAPKLRTSRIIGVRGIKTWRAFGAPSHFLKNLLKPNYHSEGLNTGKTYLNRTKGITLINNFKKKYKLFFTKKILNS